MHDNGLELPFAGELAAQLTPTPEQYLDERELIQWLSRSKK